MKALVRVGRQQWIGIVGLIVALGGVASGATGDLMTLGRNNEAAQRTVLAKTGAGPAMVFKVEAGNPPFTVNSGTLVRGLNAARLQGMRPSAFAPAAGSPNYLGAGAPQLLASQSRTMSADGVLFVDAVNAPADGTIIVTVVGVCVWGSGGSVTITASIGGDEIASPFATGGGAFVGCATSIAKEVSAGQGFAVGAAVDFTGPGSVRASMLVTFEPG